ncbi:heavy metal translocating P-type ATPase [Sulfurimonas sp. HSL-1716]|uniref:heavy metal translocating P-type ATPase n=1 Tax=Hydrocurvibacter sulfurireducens TaxID=3131937 RepID=UPI0031F8B16B
MSDKVGCTHCHLEFNKSVMIVDGEHYFCCKGCQGVYHLLKDQGLDNFYDKVGDTALTPPTQQYEDSANFDSPAFYDKFVTVNSDGFSEVSLIIEGIHCAACVWLNEKALHKMEGVISADINYTNNKAKIVWADDVLKLSSIIDMIRAIGYNAFPYDASLQEVRANKERKEYYLRMAVAIFSTMNVMWIAVAQYAGYFTGITQDVKTILNIAEGVLATPVLFYSGWIFFRGAYYGMKTKVVNMDILVATGATLTYLYSIYITMFELGEAYFDSVTMIITFVLIGKFLEILSKKSVADTLDIMSNHIPSSIKVVEEGKIVSKNINNVKVFDIIAVSSGERVALDGEVVSGEGSFDESNLTGESEPIYKQNGDKIISGTISIDADIKYKATKDFAHSTLSNLVSLLEGAMSNKPRIQQLANTLSEYFSGAILLFAFVTFIVWRLWPHSFETSFMVGISVIVIACPCALALATPVATLVGLGIASKRGILFKQAAQLETMAKANTLVLDKTGTITQGKPKVVKEHIYGEFDKSFLYSLVQSSKHPIARGVGEFIYEKDLEHFELNAVKQIPALGISAEYKGEKLIGGNIKLMQNEGLLSHDISYGGEKGEYSEFYFAYEGTVVAKYELFDTPREDSKESIKAIKAQGIEVIMLTGDHKKSAMKVAQDVGIDIVESELTPEDKSSYIEALHKEGKVVVMAGDGVNDILALASSDIGIAMGNGSDIAIDVSDVVLLHDSLRNLSDAFRISKRTYSMIKQNLMISLLYNAITIPLAMAGYIIPLIAAISMSFSSLLVVGNSMRIRFGFKDKLKG